MAYWWLLQSAAWYAAIMVLANPLMPTIIMEVLPKLPLLIIRHLGTIPIESIWTESDANFITIWIFNNNNTNNSDNNNNNYNMDSGGDRKSTRRPSDWFAAIAVWRGCRWKRSDRTVQSDRRLYTSAAREQLITMNTKVRRVRFYNIIVTTIILLYYKQCELAASDCCLYYYWKIGFPRSFRLSLIIIF